MDNFVSYRRFTSVDPNIAQYGVSVEEYKLQQGRPDPNPQLSPMATPGVAETQLALAPAGSDRLRLAGPTQPEVNPYEGPKMTLVLSRNAVRKLAGKVITDLQQIVDQGQVGDASVRTLMLDSIRRVAGMRKFMDHLNAMSESIVVKSLAASKG